MTNKEWLEKCKKVDKKHQWAWSNDINDFELANAHSYRQTKAIEIIAEELITLKEMFHRGIDLNIVAQEEKGTMNNDKEVKAETE